MDVHVAPARKDVSAAGNSPGKPADFLTPMSAQSPRDRSRFIKAKLVADRLGVCKKTIFRWADAGLIHRHKVTARTVLFDEAEVEALIKSARV